MNSIHHHRPCCRMFIALIALILAAYGCASGPTLVGRWKAVDGNATVEFDGDGKFHAVDNEGTPVAGKYRLVGQDGIQFEIRHGEADTELVDARVTRLDNRLTLSFPGDDASETYERIP
jgi:hypothetical protein